MVSFALMWLLEFVRLKKKHSSAMEMKHTKKKKKQKMQYLAVFIIAVIGS